MRVAVFNHEVKGNYASKLYRFVGSKNQKFYYNFTLDNIYGVVLDIGEDHDDDWWEYYDTANYEAYREEQVEFLNDEYIKGDYELYVQSDTDVIIGNTKDLLIFIKQ